jgi:hypothetical protein
VPLRGIDDLGMRKLPTTSAEDLLELIMRRYERASTLLSPKRRVYGRGKLLGDIAEASCGSSGCCITRTYSTAVPKLPDAQRRELAEEGFITVVEERWPPSIRKPSYSVPNTTTTSERLFARY